MNKTFEAVVVRDCIIHAGRRVILRDTGNGFFLIVKAETGQGKLASVNPFTLFLREADFVAAPHSAV